MRWEPIDAVLVQVVSKGFTMLQSVREFLYWIDDCKPCKVLNEAALQVERLTRGNLQIKPLGPHPCALNLKALKPRAKAILPCCVSSRTVWHPSELPNSAKCPAQNLNLNPSRNPKTQAPTPDEVERYLPGTLGGRSGFSRAI